MLLPVKCILCWKFAVFTASTAVSVWAAFGVNDILNRSLRLQRLKNYRSRNEIEVAATDGGLPESILHERTNKLICLVSAITAVLDQHEKIRFTDIGIISALRAIIAKQQSHEIINAIDMQIALIEYIEKHLIDWRAHFFLKPALVRNLWRVLIDPQHDPLDSHYFDTERLLASANVQYPTGPSAKDTEIILLRQRLQSLEAKLDSKQNIASQTYAKQLNRRAKLIQLMPDSPLSAAESHSTSQPDSDSDDSAELNFLTSSAFALPTAAQSMPC